MMAAYRDEMSALVALFDLRSPAAFLLVQPGDAALNGDDLEDPLMSK